MTLFDVFTIAILAVSGLLALARGFTNEMLSILAWVVAALAALWLFPYAAPFLRELVSPEWLAAAAAAVGIFVVVFVTVSIICHRWGERLHALHPRVGMLDRTLGLIFGLARGLLIVAIAYLMLGWFSQDQAAEQTWIKKARLFPLVEATANAVFELAPEGSVVPPRSGRRPPRSLGPVPTGAESEASEPSPSRATTSTQDGSGSQEADTAPDSAAAPDKSAEPGYKEAERDGLDRLFESQSRE